LSFSVAAHARPVEELVQSGTDAEKGVAIVRELAARNAGYHDFSGIVEMVLRDASGSEARRHFSLKVLERPAQDVGDQILIVFDAPADVKGTALLSHTKVNEDDDQWVYLPSAKRTKRVASSNRTSAFIGSEFTYEDLSGSEARKYDWRFLGTEPCGALQCFKLEAAPKDKASAYSKRVLSVDTSELRIVTTDFFDRAGVRVKTLAYDGYTKVGGKFWRAQDVDDDEPPDAQADDPLVLQARGPEWSLAESVLRRQARRRELSLTAVVARFGVLFFVLSVLFVTAGCATPTFSTAGRVAADGRAFLLPPKYPGQARDDNVSLAAEPEFKLESERPVVTATLRPFYRLDPIDDRRSHADLRQASAKLFVDPIEVSAGVGTFTWGVLDSYRPTDVLNQTDFVEGPASNAKLGQTVCGARLGRRARRRATLWAAVFPRSDVSGRPRASPLSIRDRRGQRVDRFEVRSLPSERRRARDVRPRRRRSRARLVHRPIAGAPVHRRAHDGAGHPAL
jgi:hypothetical protein